MKLWQVSILGAILGIPVAAQQIQDFAGTWVLRYHGRNVVILALSADREQISGSLQTPKKFAMDQSGNLTSIEPGQATHAVQQAVWKTGRLELTINDDRYVMTIQGSDGASLVPDGGPAIPWRLERVRGGEAASLTPVPEYSPEIRNLQDQLRAMVKEDQAARQLPPDLARMAAVDEKNRQEILRTYKRYGWVTESLAGVEAAHNFWLLVQHQPLELQQQFLPDLEKAARANDASMVDYSMLYDRVQMNLGKPQRFGSQVKCENGKAVLYTVEDPAGLDARRQELSLPPISEYLANEYLAGFCAGLKGK